MCVCVCIYVHLFHKEYQPITCWKHFYYFILFSISPYSLLYCLQSEFLTNKTKNILCIHSTFTLVSFLVFMCKIIMHNNKLLGNLNWKMGKTYCKKKIEGPVFLVYGKISREWRAVRRQNMTKKPVEVQQNTAWDWNSLSFHLFLSLSSSLKLKIATKPLKTAAVRTLYNKL